YTSLDGVTPGEAEQVVRVQPDASGTISTYLIGPRNPKDRSDLKLEITIHPNPDAGKILLRCPGASPGELEVALGRWSEWLRVKFKLGMLRTIRGLVRFRLVRLGNEFALYASPINFDPDSPLFPISSPEDYARELSDEYGPYYTSGMIEDHAGLSNGRIDERAFLDQCDQVWDERQQMMVHELARGKDGLTYCLFDTPDRVQHMFWRFLEPDHPANRGQTPPEEFTKVIAQQYRRADRAVGAALEFADDRTLT
ncbi:alkaline phosphatase family protein, partial [Singulisphaera rosea]